ncbi:MAG TPA: hypothetical protein VGP47_03610 [Parachlamydiaceae bacterium]|nr:hypothetical protein [Parachlamydiaceae bacterium]
MKMEPKALHPKENTMSINNSLLNKTFNQIHRWSEPEQQPMTRMFLTRITEIPCTLIETALIVIKTLELSVNGAKQLVTATSQAAVKVFPNSQLLQEYAREPLLLQDLKSQGQEISRLVMGLTSTIFIGIFFSPEANFKIHLKLGLITDNQAEKNQRALAVKLQMELQKAEITKARNARFAKLEADKQSSKDAEAQAYAVDSRLAELLMAPV